MKKLILFIIALSFSLIASAQMSTLSIPFGGSFVKGAYNATDTKVRITNTTAGYLLFKFPANQSSIQDFTIKLDSVSGNHTNVAAQLYGQKSEYKGDWTAIGSAVNWKGTSKDTIMTVSNASTVSYQNFKWVLTGTGTGVTRVLYTELKAYLK